MPAEALLKERPTSPSHAIPAEEIERVVDSVHHNGAAMLCNEFQPIWKIDEQTLYSWDPPRDITHFEALARVRGRPGAIAKEVIKRIEERKLEHKFFEAMTRTALRGAQQNGVKPTINIPPRELVCKHLAAEIEHWMEITDTHPWEVGIEISERSSADDVKRALKKLLHLRRNGVKIILDDANYDKKRLLQILDLINCTGERIDAVKIDMDPVLNLDDPDREIDAIAVGEIRQVMNAIEGRCRMLICEGLNAPSCEVEIAKQQHLLKMCPQDFVLAGQGGMSVDAETAGKILKGEMDVSPHPLHLTHCNECTERYAT